MGSVTTTSVFHAVSSVAVTALDVARVEPPTLDSQMVDGLALRVTVARWSPATWLPYFSVGYWFAVPKSHGSSLPVTPSRLRFQSL